MNLGSNAIKWTPEGGRATLRATVLEETESAATVTFDVVDTGRGIPEAKRKQLFKDYARIIEEGEAPAPGTGLGLVISRKLVLQMGGDELDVHSPWHHDGLLAPCVPQSSPRKTHPAAATAHPAAEIGRAHV